MPDLSGSGGGQSVLHVSSAELSSLGKKKWNLPTEYSCISFSSLSIPLVLPLVWLETIGTTLWKNEEVWRKKMDGNGGCGADVRGSTDSSTTVMEGNKRRNDAPGTWN